MPHYKKIYIYRDSHLPEEGWIQSCFHCYTYTSSVIDYTFFKYKKVIYECDVYLCESCETLLQEDNTQKERFRNRCDRYIRKLFPSRTETT